MFSKILSTVFGSKNSRELKRLSAIVKKINSYSDDFKKLSDEELAGKTPYFKELLEKGQSLDSILPEAFATAREAATRVLGMRHYDCQLIGGMVLNGGNIAEMRTGEGKTLVGTLPVYLNALTGKGVHVVTVNDYLVTRDAAWMKPLYEFLGLTVGTVVSRQPAHEKQAAYQCDITYCTNNELGFDYLRDNMCFRLQDRAQRGHAFALVDEVDSILIDEARTPLIISAPASENPESYEQFAKVAAKLAQSDYILDEKRKMVALTDDGVEKVQRMLGVKNIYSPEYVRSVYHLDQALRAQTLFKRDKDYVVTKDGEVVIVDEFTGRLMNGRRYNEGLHQAIEAKENVPILQESMTLATISFQNYFRLYKKLSGMTGTAFTEAEEFQQIYKLDVVQVPSNRPIAREDREDLIFRTEKAKLKAIADVIKEHHKEGRPVLVGSASIAKNELIAAHLDKEKIPYEILNAKNNEREAAIIEKAGEKGAITLATNIAGRGTDIKLGEGVKELGGLVVIGSERHESRRIDNQLRGRGGRQGDPGITQFYVSTEDDLMRIFQGERIAALMGRIGVDDDMPLQHKMVSKTLEAAQKRVEGYNFDNRKNVVQYDNVINRHRRVVYVIRRKILEGADIKTEIERLIDLKVRELTVVPSKNNKNFFAEFEEIFPINDKKLKTIGAEKRDKQRYELAKKEVEKLYKAKEAELETETLRKVEREVYLQVLDTLWMQHLENMQHLREGIHWRSVGQRDPLVEYRSESQKLFDSLQATLRDEVLRAIMHVTVRDAVARAEEDHDTELTRLAENSVEKGVNEVLKGEASRDDEFKVQKGEKTNDAQRKKNTQRKKKKAQRQNRKSGRR